MTEPPATRLLPVSLAVALLPVACADSSPSDLRRVQTHRASGSLTVRVAGRTRRLELADADCDTRRIAGREYLDVTAPDTREYRDAAGNRVRFDLLQATTPSPAGAGSPIAFGPGRQQTPDSSQIGAIASLPETEVEGRSYSLLQMIARPLESPHLEFSCRLRGRGRRLDLSCEGARPFPWLAPGPVPRASFRAEVRCSSRADDGKTPPTRGDPTP